MEEIKGKKESCFHGKVIYQPKGKAGEYAKWAVNFYVGCSNGCSYCYCKRGVLSHALGGSSPKLKSVFYSLAGKNGALKDCQSMAETCALACFADEFRKNRESIMKDGGLFYSFSTDPCLRQTFDLTYRTAINVTALRIPVTILTKCTWWVDGFIRDFSDLDSGYPKSLFNIGFTLTGHDELEPGAASNAERMEAMRKLHDNGFHVWSSIEPVIDCPNSWGMIRSTIDFCDYYRIGLLSGASRDYYDRHILLNFVEEVRRLGIQYDKKFYFKKSVKDYVDEVCDDSELKNMIK